MNNFKKFNNCINISPSRTFKPNLPNYSIVLSSLPPILYLKQAPFEGHRSLTLPFMTSLYFQLVQSEPLFFPIYESLKRKTLFKVPHTLSCFSLLLLARWGCHHPSLYTHITFFPWPTCFTTLKMEAACFPETSLNIYKPAWRHIPENIFA